MANDPRDEASSLLNFEARMVTLVVGPEKREFFVHSSHLQRASHFFRAAFEKQWKEGQESKITLEHDDAKTVGLYLHFAYTGKIPCRGPKDNHKARSNGKEYKILARIYCFGEKIQDVRFKNAVIDAIIAKCRHGDSSGIRYLPSYKIVDILYKGTCPGSPARRLMVDITIKEGKEDLLEGGTNNHDFLIDLGKAFFKDQRERERALHKAEAEADGEGSVDEDDDDDEDVEDDSDEDMDSDDVEKYRNADYHEAVE